MKSSEGTTPLTKTGLNNNGDVVFEKPKAFERLVKRFVRQRNALIVASSVLLVACVVLLVCLLLKDAPESSCPANVCTSVSCMERASGKTSGFRRHLFSITAPKLNTPIHPHAYVCHGAKKCVLLFFCEGAFCIVYGQYYGCVLYYAPVKASLYHLGPHVALILAIRRLIVPGLRSAHSIPARASHSGNVLRVKISVP